MVRFSDCPASPCYCGFVILWRKINGWGAAGDGTLCEIALKERFAYATASCWGAEAARCAAPFPRKLANLNPKDWANESHALAQSAWLSSGAHVDENYYQEQIKVVDKRLALAGLRLAAVLNEAFAQVH